MVSLSGRVVAEDAEPIPEALIEILELGVKVYSDRSGQFTIPDLAAGRYTLRIIATGFLRRRETVQLDADVGAFEASLTRS